MYSLPTLLDPAGVSWKYYAASNGWARSIWTAPNAISAICLPLQNGECNGADWLADVVHGTNQILADIATCNLRKVSWVIPLGNASDHPGFGNGETDSRQIEDGPAWVANIINAVGANPTCEDGEKYWNNTVIFVVWDDWGGWWDHIDPGTVPDLGVQVNCQDWGCGYSYGFRVPLLVVSAYTPAGYVSGAVPPNGPGMVYPYIHDFGSILAFIENNFLGQSQIGHINSQNQYPFADAFAPELRHDPSAIPLADFFCSNSPCVPQQFQPIPLSPGAPGPDYFINYAGPLTDPDDDAIDDD